MKRIHCSSLPRVLSCPASLRAAEVHIDAGDSDASRIGSAVHAALAHYVLGGEVPDLDALSLKFGVERAQVAPLFFIGRRILADYEDAFTVDAVEVKAEDRIAPDIMIVGTGDIVGTTDAGELLIWDWKSGVPTADHRAQLLGYAWLWREKAKTGSAKLAICYLRDQSVEITDINMDEGLEEFERMVADAVAHPDTYNPTWENCRFCGRQSDCPARRQLIRSAVLDMAVSDKIEALAPADLAALYPKVKLLEQALTHYHATLRNVVTVNGPQLTGDGRELRFQDRHRVEILLEPAWPVLLEQFGNVEVFTDALSVSRPALCDLVRGGVGRGQKGAAVDEFMLKLSQAGALRTAESTALVAAKIRGDDDE